MGHQLQGQAIYADGAFFGKLFDSAHELHALELEGGSRQLFNIASAQNCAKVDSRDKQLSQ